MLLELLLNIFLDFDNSEKYLIFEQCLHFKFLIPVKEEPRIAKRGKQCRGLVTGSTY